ncbi:hypothetical protein [Thermovenabulum sp.]|uniref:hypothetical protein n=1 Tax=Thermovenabulum sp. TaxID=3100335 RepID=UPI003C7B25C7
MNCPICGKNEIGKVGTNQYFCWECLMEFSVNSNKIVVYEVADDGSLIPYMEKLCPAEMRN